MTGGNLSSVAMVWIWTATNMDRNSWYLEVVPYLRTQAVQSFKVDPRLAWIWQRVYDDNGPLFWTRQAVLDQIDLWELTRYNDDEVLASYLISPRNVIHAHKALLLKLRGRLIQAWSLPTDLPCKPRFRYTIEPGRCMWDPSCMPAFSIEVYNSIHFRSFSFWHDTDHFGRPSPSLRFHSAYAISTLFLYGLIIHLFSIQTLSNLEPG